jgi:hypothetical protein
MYAIISIGGVHVSIHIRWICNMIPFGSMHVIIPLGDVHASIPIG